MTVLAALYSLLFAASLILINPWGTGHTSIWTQPKVVVVVLITVLNLSLILRHIRRKTIALSTPWKKALGLWLIFLTVGCAATLFSLSPLSSLLGWSHIGINLIYWWLLAGFVLSNAVVLQLKPSLFYPQFFGFLAAGALLTFSIFPQVLNSDLDYTATLGQMSSQVPQRLASGIWLSEMPIGFYSHRGHAAFGLAAVGTLVLVGASRGWVQPILAGATYVLITTALFYTQTRGAVLALLAGIIYLLWCFRSSPNKRRMVLVYGVGLLLASYLLFQALAALLPVSLQKLSLDNTSNFFSEPTRPHQWKLALKGIISRPLWGWGFGGFGSAYPFVADWAGKDQVNLFEGVPVAQVLQSHEFIFEYLGIDGKVHAGFIETTKAHNLLLDATLSVGIIGLLTYLLLLGFCLWSTAKGPFRGIEAVVIVYLVYTLTWYESAQFSHLPWWALSIGLSRLPSSKVSGLRCDRISRQA